MELDIVIGKDGSLRLDIQGEKGEACLDTVKLFKELVGETAQKKLKSDYYERDARITRNARA